MVQERIREVPGGGNDLRRQGDEDDRFLAQTQTFQAAVDCLKSIGNDAGPRPTGSEIRRRESARFRACRSRAPGLGVYDAIAVPEP